jgi:hypothetical protein
MDANSKGGRSTMFLEDYVPPGLPRVVLGLAAIVVIVTFALAMFH